MKNIIRIKNAVFYAYHGAFSEEQSIGGKFEVDLDILTDFSEAAKTDTLESTIDYDKAYQLIRNLVVKRKFFLIETLAMSISDEILNSFPNALELTVKVRKNNVPLGGVIDYAEVEVTKSRNDD